MELAWASTDDLLKEMMNRFEHAVFCGLKPAEDDGHPITGHWHGNAITCVGLANAISQAAMRHCEFDEEQIEDDEEE